MTKEEIKNLIAGITKENTTESLHAEVLNAIVDAMPEGGGELTTIDIPNETQFEDFKLDVTSYFRGKFNINNPAAYRLRTQQGCIYYFKGAYTDIDGSLHAMYGFYLNSNGTGNQIYLTAESDGKFYLTWTDEQ